MVRKVLKLSRKNGGIKRNTKRRIMKKIHRGGMIPGDYTAFGNDEGDDETLIADLNIRQNLFGMDNKINPFFFIDHMVLGAVVTGTDGTG